MTTISTERLKEIAETVYDDPDEMNKAINELAISVLEIRQSASPVAQQPSAQTNSPRMKARALEPGQKTSTCSKCHSDIAIFKSKSGKFYPCDIELDYIGNVRQMVTAPNWLHKCGGGR